MFHSDRLIKRTWWLAVAAVVLYCLVAFFFWSLIDVVTPFAAPLLWLPVVALALTALVFSAILPFRRWSTRRIPSLLPLVFLITCALVTRFVDFTALWLAANFRLHYTDRQEIVRRIQSGELRPNVPHNASLLALPSEFAPASLGGGEVVVERGGDRLKVLFFTFRGVLDNFAGFVYTADGSAPKNGDFGDEFVINRKLQDRWYYVSAH